MSNARRLVTQFQYDQNTFDAPNDHFDLQQMLAKHLLMHDGTSARSSLDIIDVYSFDHV